MGNRSMDAPLAVQMDRLKKTMHNRDKRRDQDRQQRLVSTAAEDPYVQSTRVKSSVGGVKLGPGAAAQAAVANAAALEGPALIRCELCQANFRNAAMLRQHEEGPAHKKAVARDKAQKEREAWMENPSAAANALQAAAWLNGEGAMSKQPASKGPPRYANQAGRGRGQGRGAATAQAEVQPQQRGPSHADLIARAKRMNEPISIDGWIPPPLEVPAQPTEADDPSEGKHDEPETSNEAARQHEKAGVTGHHTGGLEHRGDGSEDVEQRGDKGLGLVDYGDSSGDDTSDSETETPRAKIDSFF